jgi:hypothetical protein
LLCVIKISDGSSQELPLPRGKSARDAGLFPEGTVQRWHLPHYLFTSPVKEGFFPQDLASFGLVIRMKFIFFPEAVDTDWHRRQHKVHVPPGLNSKPVRGDESDIITRFFN